MSHKAPNPDLQTRLNELDSRKAIRALLGAGPNERTVDAARRLIAERDRLLLKVADLELAIRELWDERDADAAE